jgi:hypothetical protein
MDSPECTSTPLLPSSSPVSHLSHLSPLHIILFLSLIFLLPAYSHRYTSSTPPSLHLAHPVGAGHHIVTAENENKHQHLPGLR